MVYPLLWVMQDLHHQPYGPLGPKASKYVSAEPEGLLQSSKALGFRVYGVGCRV